MFLFVAKIRFIQKCPTTIFVNAFRVTNSYFLIVCVRVEQLKVTNYELLQSVECLNHAIFLVVSNSESSQIIDFGSCNGLC